jgi:predicted RNA binding protein YcfA (HicA-like mRNA interferase family)
VVLLSGRQKRLDKIHRNPKNVSWNELLSVLKDYGFEIKPPRRGSHYSITHPVLAGVVEILPKPHSGPVPEYKVREILELVALVEEVGENAKNWPSED